jgi:8-hydroxy-5-deazaflavin:NADPH oxidoreductase
MTWNSQADAGVSAGMTIDGVKTVGLIGAGNIGSQIVRAAIGSGYDVVISNS